jgi:sec-independent protein translocase protein TatB
MFLEGKTLELMLAAVFALVVVGPKDLPVLLRRFGQFMAKLRGMAAEFRASFDEMARQSELDDLRKEVEALRKGQLAEIAGMSPTSEINQTAADIHQSLAEVGVQLHPTYDYAAPLPETAPEPPPLTIAAAEPKPKAKPKSGAKPRAKAAAAKAPAPKRTAGKPGAKKAAKPAAAKPHAKAAKS